MIHILIFGKTRMVLSSHAMVQIQNFRILMIKLVLRSHGTCVGPWSISHVVLNIEIFVMISPKYENFPYDFKMWLAIFPPTPFLLIFFPFL